MPNTENKAVSRHVTPTRYPGITQGTSVQGTPANATISGGFGAQIAGHSGGGGRFDIIKDFLARPEVKAGLLQYGISALNPGSTIGSSFGDALGATGRYIQNQEAQRLAQEQAQMEALQKQREFAYKQYQDQRNYSLKERTEDRLSGADAREAEAHQRTMDNYERNQQRLDVHASVAAGNLQNTIANSETNVKFFPDYEGSGRPALVTFERNLKTGGFEATDIQFVDKNSQNAGDFRYETMYKEAIDAGQSPSEAERFAELARADAVQTELDKVTGETTTYNTLTGEKIDLQSNLATDNSALTQFNQQLSQQPQTVAGAQNAVLTAISSIPNFGATQNLPADFDANAASEVTLLGLSDDVAGIDPAISRVFATLPVDKNLTDSQRNKVFAKNIAEQATRLLAVALAQTDRNAASELENIISGIDTGGKLWDNPESYAVKLDATNTTLDRYLDVFTRQVNNPNIGSTRKQDIYRKIDNLTVVKKLLGIDAAKARFRQIEASALIHDYSQITKSDLLFLAETNYNPDRGAEILNLIPVRVISSISSRDAAQ